MPKLNHYAHKGERDPLTQVKDSHEQELILKTIKASEGFVLFSGIAMGITQILTLKQGDKKEAAGYRYLRTFSTKHVSEATMIYYLQKHIFHMLAEKPDSAIIQIIRKQQGKAAKCRTLW